MLIKLVFRSNIQITSYTRVEQLNYLLNLLVNSNDFIEFHVMNLALICVYQSLTVHYLQKVCTIQFSIVSSVNSANSSPLFCYGCFKNITTVQFIIYVHTLVVNSNTIEQFKVFNNDQYWEQRTIKVLTTEYQFIVLSS